MSLDASTLAAKTIRDYARYLDDTEYDWIDYESAPHLDFQGWAEREGLLEDDPDA